MKREKEFTIGLTQLELSGSPQENMSRAQEGIKEAARRGAQIICLPELFMSPYFCSRASAEFFELAEPAPAGDTVSALQPLAKKLNVVLIVPIFERRAPGVYHNSAVVLDADGSIAGMYRKMHIPDDPLYYEKFYFTPGDSSPEESGFRIFRTKYADVGVLICWDQWYPEAARITALAGAEVIFYPTAIGWHPKEKATLGEEQANGWETVQRGHAIANGVYVAAVNRVGFEATSGTDGLEFFGRSFICDPFGQIIAKSTKQEPEVLIAKCDREHIEEIRRGWPFLRDRRIDAYRPILSRYTGS